MAVSYTHLSGLYKIFIQIFAVIAEFERDTLTERIVDNIDVYKRQVYDGGSDLDPNNYALNVEALKHLQKRGDLRFLHQFHELLQKSVSHYNFSQYLEHWNHAKQK